MADVLNTEQRHKCMSHIKGKDTSLTPVAGIDPYACEIERKGQLRFAQYFTTMDKFLEYNELWDCN